MKGSPDRYILIAIASKRKQAEVAENQTSSQGSKDASKKQKTSVEAEEDNKSKEVEAHSGLESTEQ